VFNINPRGEHRITTPNDRNIFHFRENFRALVKDADENRAMHNCPVTFKVHPSKGNYKTVTVVDVEYSRSLEFNGFLNYVDGTYFFEAMDSKYGTFIVTDITIFTDIKMAGQADMFSRVKPSLVDPKYIERHFFRAKFTHWSQY
jgi:hypothetical protein